MVRFIKPGVTPVLRLGLMVAMFMVSSAAIAEDMVLNDLKALDSVQLSVDELKQLLPNAKVVSYSKGNTRRWTNKTNGKFTASSDARGQHALGKGGLTGQGVWHVGEEGTYCVKIEWPKHTENWCKYMFKAGDAYYGVNSVSDGAAKVNRYEISH